MKGMKAKLVLLLAAVMMMTGFQFKQPPTGQTFKIAGSGVTFTDDVAKEMTDEMTGGLKGTMDKLMTWIQSNWLPADQTVVGMYDLVVKEDAAPITNLLGFASEEDAKTALLSPDYKGMAETLKDELTSAGVSFTDDEMKEMTDTMKGMLAKLTCTATIQSQTKDETTVLLKVTGYSSKDIADIMTNMDQDTAKAIVAGDQEAVQKMLKNVMKQYVAKLGELQPSTDTTDVTVKCEKHKVKVNGKDEDVWLPADTDKFMSDIGAATLRN